MKLPDLLEWYSTRFRPDTLCELPTFYAPAARFTNPFNDVHDATAIAGVFAHMFENITDAQVNFGDVLALGDRAFVTWRFHFRVHERLLMVHGGAYLQFDADGRVCRHRDCWDAVEATVELLPVHVPLRWLRPRFALPQSTSVVSK